MRIQCMSTVIGQLNFPCSVRNDHDTYIESVILTHNIPLLYVWGSGLVLVYS